MIVVVTGASRAGKSTLCRALADVLHLPIHNVGDALLDVMTSRQTGFRGARPEVGQKFLEEFGVTGYVEVVRHLTNKSCIIDGLRLADGLRILSCNDVQLVHVHRPTPRHLPRHGDFESDILRAMAHTYVPWAQSHEDLGKLVYDLALTISSMGVQSEPVAASPSRGMYYGARDLTYHGR